MDSEQALGHLPGYQRATAVPMQSYLVSRAGSQPSGVPDGWRSSKVAIALLSMPGGHRQSPGDVTTQPLSCQYEISPP